MKKIKAVSLMLACTVLFSGCMPADATGLSEDDITFIQLEEVQDGAETAEIETSLGTITMVLFPKEAPNTVAYFKKLVNEGFYTDKPIFPDSSAEIMISGTDGTDLTQGVVNTDDGKPIECEITPNLWHFSGAVSVLGYEKSKLSRQMLSDSRFFIIGSKDATTDMVNQMEEYHYPQKVIDAYKEHGGLPQYTGSYTVFGQVIDGMDVVDKIVALAVGEDKLPKDGTKILSVKLSTYKGEKGAAA